MAWSHEHKVVAAVVVVAVVVFAAAVAVVVVAVVAAAVVTAAAVVVRICSTGSPSLLRSYKYWHGDKEKWGRMTFLGLGVFRKHLTTTTATTTTATTTAATAA